MENEPIGTRVVRELKRVYPNPVAAEANTLPEKGYCVGGAICMAILYAQPQEGVNPQGSRWRFPGDKDLTKMLLRVSPALAAHPNLETEAYRITDLNDSEKFEAAWDLLEKLLNWKPEVLPLDEPKARKHYHEPNRLQIHIHRMAHENRGLRLRFRNIMRKGGA